MTAPDPANVVALVDASGPFTLGSLEATFPEASADEWRRAAELDPGAFGADGRWQLDFRCFLIHRPGGRFTLVDAGVGPEASPAAGWAPVPGRLPEALLESGVDPGAVDTVVLTHLHPDHVGWSVRPDGRPRFPNARYVVQRAEIEELEARGGGPILDAVVRPLRRAEQLHEVDGRTRLTSGPTRPRLTLLPTPGHTLGHQSVLVEAERHDIVITGDVLVHAVQLVNPDVRYAHEHDAPLARRTRRAVLADAVERGALLATAHLRQPFVAASP